MCPSGMIHYGGYGLWKMWRCDLQEDDGITHTDEELHKKMSTFDETASWCSVRMADLKYPSKFHRMERG